MPGLVALIFGFLAFRSRIKGVYFSILTQALTYAVCLLFFRNDFTFGGNNGFTDFKDVLGFDLNADSTTRGLFVATVVLLAITYWVTSGLLYSKVWQGAASDPRLGKPRALFRVLTTSYKLIIFVLSAMIAGAAGALYVPLVGGINPSVMEPAKSLEVVVWVAVGGRGTKWGPVIGAILVNFIKSYTTQACPDYWLIIMGMMFVLVVLFMPNGIVGLYANAKAYLHRKKSLQPTAAKKWLNTTIRLYRDTPLILSVSGVTKSFDGFKAIDDLNFYLEEGELRTIIGPNGAGKSTFMDIITGRTRPDTGSVVLHEKDGHDINLAKLREHEINRLGIGRKFQTPSIYKSHTVYDNLVLSLNKSRGVLQNLFLPRIEGRSRPDYGCAENSSFGTSRR